MVLWIESPTGTILICHWKRALQRGKRRGRKKTKERGREGRRKERREGRRKEGKKEGREEGGEELLITAGIEETSDGLSKTLSLNSAYSHLCINTVLYASKWTTEKNHRKTRGIFPLFFFFLKTLNLFAMISLAAWGSVFRMVASIHCRQGSPLIKSKCSLKGSLGKEGRRKSILTLNWQVPNTNQIETIKGKLKISLS